jgi:hypothetical protein
VPLIQKEIQQSSRGRLQTAGGNKLCINAFWADSFNSHMDAAALAIKLYLANLLGVTKICIHYESSKQLTLLTGLLFLYHHSQCTRK